MAIDVLELGLGLAERVVVVIVLPFAFPLKLGLDKLLNRFVVPLEPIRHMFLPFFRLPLQPQYFALVFAGHFCSVFFLEQPGKTLDFHVTIFGGCLLHLVWIIGLKRRNFIIWVGKVKDRTERLFW